MFRLLVALYRTLLWLGTPILAVVAIAHPRLRGTARERWGFARLELEPGGVWIHAASLGEGRVAAALIPRIREHIAGTADGLAAHVEVLRTCTSATARPQAVGADQTLYAPFDHPLAVRAFLDRARPRCLILVEAELWPILLEACRARDIPVAVVNARLGPKQRRWLRFPAIWAGLTREICWVAPDQATARLIGGVAVGDVKGEAEASAPSLTWSRPAVLAGSTHAGEEAALIEAVLELDPRPLLVLAPRDPRRFDAVWSLLTAGGLVVRRRTRIGTVVEPEVDVVLLDTIGELASLYRSASAAFVGGTFSPEVGGHSPAEPAAAGCPVVHGPHIHANPGAWATVAGFPARNLEALGSALEAALASPTRSATGSSAPAARATVRALGELWEAETPAEGVPRPWLSPLTPLWALGVWTRSLGGATRVPGGVVISVGALSAGGTGKTPVAAWVVGVTGGTIVSRGYGRDKGDDVRSGGEANRIGDELTMLARRGVPVISSPDRVAGVRAAFQAGGPDRAGHSPARTPIAVLDDGLQVAGIARDLDIVAVDARYPGSDGLIPAGTRRLPLSWLGRADVLWLNHATAETPVPRLLRPHLRDDAIIVRASYRSAGWLFRGSLLPLNALPRRPVAAFAGIARPEGFFRQLRRLGLPLDRTWVFPDHHRYAYVDLQSLEAWRDTHVIVTTEKDAARLPPDESIWALRIEIEVHTGEGELRARLLGLTSLEPA